MKINRRRLWLSLLFVFVTLLNSSGAAEAAILPSPCNPQDHLSLISFLTNFKFNFNTSNSDCCHWDGISCTPQGRVSRISLPEIGISTSTGTSIPSLQVLSNLTFLSHLNLSNSHLSGPLPDLTPLLFLPLLTTLDLSSNHFNSAFPIPNSLIFPTTTTTTSKSNLASFNLSNNSFSGPLPSSLCHFFPRLHTLDFSINSFTGPIPISTLSQCSHLQIFRAALNSLSGPLPYNLYALPSLEQISLSNNRLSGTINTTLSNLSNLTILQLHVNQFTGPIPSNIGLLSKLEQLQLHTNSLNGTIPHSLTACSSLKTLLLRNNHFTGQIASLDFSKLKLLEAIDLGNNSFVGPIPQTLCFCKSLTALRLAYNQLVGEVPACMASLAPLSHLSLSDNLLTNVVGAFNTLTHCANLAVLFLSRCFHDEAMPDDRELYLEGFHNLQILTLGGCKLTGPIPAWIAKLRRLKVLNLSYNNITGPIPAWIGDMPSLLVLNLTQNHLSGPLPREIGRLPALIADNTSSDLSSLALPFLFDSQQYNRLFNLPRGLKVGSNNLSGNIPEEIGQLKLLQNLDLSSNKFDGKIPDELSNLVNLEKLNMSRNHLTGEIPESLTRLHFLSYFSVADNDLQGEIPRGWQFDTFSASSFEGNPKLCGDLVRRSCQVRENDGEGEGEGEGEPEEEGKEISWYYNVPFGLGYLVGFFAISITLFFNISWKWTRGVCGDTETDNLETVSLWQFRS